MTLTTDASLNWVTSTSSLILCRGDYDDCDSNPRTVRKLVKTSELVSVIATGIYCCSRSMYVTGHRP